MTGPKPIRRVFLIGFMGAGKTSVGKALAQRLGWKFYDLDQLIEGREQKTIASIFAEAGESGFRKIESAALNDLLELDHFDGGSVVALGGGTFVLPDNRQAIQQAGAVVLLSAPLEELARRCHIGSNSRPLAREKAGFEQLFASRQQAYALAHFRVETAGKHINEIAEEIEKILSIRQ